MFTYRYSKARQWLRASGLCAGLALGTAPVLTLGLALALGSSASMAQEARAPAMDARLVSIAGSQLRFAPLADARAALSAQDIWLDMTSDFQRAATMGVGGPVATERFREFLAGTALDWSPPQLERWRKAALAIAPRLEALKVRLPSQILLVQTTGQDAAGAPYTRANAIFLPAGFAGPVPDTELLAHELFHVITRNDPALATRLYRELGFESAAELEWPPEWLPARIANPDAPRNQHAMRIESGGKGIYLMPLLVARRTALSPGETFFSVLDVRLLAVEPGTGGQPSRAQRNAQGELVWQPASRTASYLARLGGNTDYIFHPEETAADNFAYLVTGRSVPNQELLRRFEAVLTAPR